MTGAIFLGYPSGDDHEVRLARRSAEHLGAEARDIEREADIDIISMAQQASPKVMGQMEFLRAQFTARSRLVSTIPSDRAAAVLATE